MVMNTIQEVTCHICLEDMDIDDSVWADEKGNVEKPYFAYCVSCLPPQEEKE